MCMVFKSIEKYRKVSKCIEKYRNVSKSIEKYPKVCKRIQKYPKVLGSVLSTKTSIPKIQKRKIPAIILFDTRNTRNTFRYFLIIFDTFENFL